MIFLGDTVNTMMLLCLLESEILIMLHLIFIFGGGGRGGNFLNFCLSRILLFNPFTMYLFLVAEQLYIW